MSKLEERALQRVGTWDFKTVVNGKEVLSLDIKAIAKKEEAVETAKHKAIYLASLKTIPGEQLFEMLKPDSGLVKKEPEDKSKNKTFVNLEDFSRWYIANKEEFTEPQQEALNTLPAIAEMVGKGCKCKESQRRGVAYGYFQKFITSNSETDILKKVKEVGGFDSISFLVVEGAEPFLKV